MNIANLRRAADLARDAERLERTIRAYREADEINVSLIRTYSRGSHMPERVESDHAKLTAAEIGDAVVEALQHRLAKKRAELTGLGVTTGAAGDAGRP